MIEEENIFDQIKYEQTGGKNRLYRSKHPPNLLPTGSTFGLSNQSAFIVNINGDYDDPQFIHSKRNPIPTMGTIKGQLSPNPRNFLKKGESIKQAHRAKSPSLFKIKTCKNARKCDQISNNKKPNMNESSNNISQQEDLVGNANIQNQKLTRLKVGSNNKRSIFKSDTKDVAKSMSLNPIEEESEISKGPISQHPNILLNKRPMMKHDIEKLHLPTINSISNSNYGTKLGRNVFKGGQTFEQWRNRDNGAKLENVMSEEDREILRDSLLAKWDDLNFEYQSFTHKRQLTHGMLTKKKDLEQRLLFIEESIKKLDNPVICVAPTSGTNGY